MIKNSIIMPLAVLCLANTARAMDCRGVWVDNGHTPFMLTDSLKEPYAKWVEGIDPTFVPCPSGIKKIDPTDFHQVNGAERANRLECEWPGGSHQGWTILDQSTSGNTRTINLFSDGSRARRLLTVDLTSGNAEYFNVTEQGLVKVSSSLTCTF